MNDVSGINLYDAVRDGPKTREQVLELIGGPAPRCYIADHFSLFCAMPWLVRFLMRYELMQRIINVHGSIVECGVKSGVGMLEWGHLSRILEPYARRRIVYGFDTFTGFPSVHAKDGERAGTVDMQDCTQKGGSNLSVVMNSIAMASQNFVIMAHEFENALAPNRFGYLHNWTQMMPIVGDFMSSGPKFISQNPQLVVALLYLDFDLYDPTKKAIELFVPRMPKGAIIAFDELDHPDWPGETIALVETLGIGKLRLQRFPWETTVSYAVLE